MNFNEVFPRRPVFLAVIHVESTEGALYNTSIARECGADGVFLTNHAKAVSAHGLCCAYRVVRKEHADWWIGLNMLDLHRPLIALNQLPLDANGLWTDALDPPDSMSGAIFKDRLKEKRKKWDGLYFGGVAFKGQPPETDFVAAAMNGKKIVDVVTTSGRVTGSPPSVAKVTEIKSGAGDTPVAIASGIDSGNVGDYAGLADFFMVATSIGKTFTELDPVKVRELTDEVHKLRPR